MQFSPTQRAPRRLAFAFVIGLYSTCAALQTNDLPQRPSGSLARYEFRQAHDPDGIGKFYMGREIAQVMGHQGAEWLERAERGAEEAPDVLFSQLKIQPGATVADIGAGTGYLTRRLARQVAPAGSVFAVDIQPEMLAILTTSAARVGLTN
jgi:2-polyprenyl-3-methyl-5-hydroxy-6-metoxy-1,4-benzoquinol methylase